MTKAERKRRDAKLKKYGLTRAEWESMRRKQKGICAVCLRPSEKPLVIDHCHKTGKVRGLLCGHCNTMLGFAKDNAVTLLSGSMYVDREVWQQLMRVK